MFKFIKIPEGYQPTKEENDKYNKMMTDVVVENFDLLNDMLNDKNNDIIQTNGEVQLLKRQWWQLYKKGWQKHRDIWNRRWWIRFKWNKEDNKNIEKTLMRFGEFLNLLMIEKGVLTYPDIKNAVKVWMETKLFKLNNK